MRCVAAQGRVVDDWRVKNRGLGHEHALAVVAAQYHVTEVHVFHLAFLLDGKDLVARRNGRRDDAGVERGQQVCAARAKVMPPIPMAPKEVRCVP